MQSPVYSIIIPLYNKADKIARTIESVLSQSVVDFEAVIVDDGSKDGSADVVKCYQDARIRYVRKENGGVSSARNRGIAEAQGEWMLFLDADDQLLPDALATFEEMRCRFPKYQILVAGLHNYRDEKHQMNDGVSFFTSRYPYRSLWLNRFYPRPGSAVSHKSLIDEYGGFDERISFYEDFEFYFRMLQAGRVVYTTKVVMQYNQEEGGLSLSHHSEKKEMAYYLPEKKLTGFFQKAIYYENVEYEIYWWRDNPEVKAYYVHLREANFSPIYAVVHWVRQKLVRRNII